MQPRFVHLHVHSHYSFCKAHSTAYALISYWTVFLKARCPAHYFAALLTTQTGYYAPWIYVAEARRAGAPILFLLLHDGEGMIEVTVPPDRYLRLFRQIDPAGVLVRGRLAGDGTDAPPLPRRLIAEEVIPLTEIGNDPI